MEYKILKANKGRLTNYFHILLKIGNLTIFKICNIFYAETKLYASQQTLGLKRPYICTFKFP